VTAVNVVQEHLAKESNWPVATADVVSALFPSRAGKSGYMFQVFSRFHSFLEDLKAYFMSVTSTVHILGYRGSEIEVIKSAAKLAS
jgi:hypothetical protein